MPINGNSTPPPVIGKIGPYTVFMTPPSTPKPAAQPVFDSPKKVVPPPVQPPPQQFDKSIAVSDSVADGSVLGFFKNAVNKVQNAHSSLDDHLARWFGLNQSKYQWALDDYYESKGLVSILDLSFRTAVFVAHSLFVWNSSNWHCNLVLWDGEGDLRGCVSFVYDHNSEMVSFVLGPDSRLEAKFRVKQKREAQKLKRCQLKCRAFNMLAKTVLNCKRARAGFF
ncbi:hypothetical protein FEM48_Zijuj01G0010900 [Ziziphus jujuba var. spinosa]|uniref:Uncharacterized protein n=1 Tax=Ziziphus jujuba var. spinosa TaxID=714518 RepID=A0A978VY91_ZIZJJ|nr:hypothetical protein FEM48_Zijuj01G0010900 [Ziziphus jujuba var. spinosa]